MKTFITKYVLVKDRAIFESNAKHNCRGRVKLKQAYSAR